MNDNSDNLPDEFKIITQPAKERLNQRQLMDYRNHRRKLTKWLWVKGKNPKDREGYSKQSVRYHIYRIDKFYRWVWNQEDGYTTSVTTDHADEYMEELAYSDESNAHKKKTQQALKVLFKWKKHEQGGEEWSPDRTFSTQKYQPRDYFTIEERKKLREAALEYGSIPGYNDLDPEERDQWKAYLAQRFEKPKSDVSPSDWKKANGWKIPSLVWTSLDAGLRPVEVERAVTSWVDLDTHLRSFK
ncbi:MAG: site-specific recombinase xerd [Halobacteriales archaeon]